MRGIGVRGDPEAATQGRSGAGLRLSPAERRSPTWAEETLRVSGEEGHPNLAGPDLAVIRPAVPSPRTALLGAPGAVAPIFPRNSSLNPGRERRACQLQTYFLGEGTEAP